MISDFTNDNCAGIHPKVLNSLEKNNKDHQRAYGNDFYTKKAKNLFKKVFENENLEIEFLYNGTAANCLVLKSILKENESAICSDCSYLNTVEYGLYKENKKINLIKIKNENGKIDLINLEKAFEDNLNKNPKILSITQPTEHGTIYLKNEIKEISNFCVKKNLVLIMDGARISNAAEKLNLNFKKFTSDCGVQILCFGGTKNGLFCSEAVLFFDKEFHKKFKSEKKKHFQLIPKSRFIAIQFIEFFKNKLWLRNAKNANKMANLLKKEFLKLNLEISKPVDVNMIFAKIPKDKIKILQKKYDLAVFNKENPETRFVTAWDTKKSDIIDIIKYLKKIK